MAHIENIIRALELAGMPKTAATAALKVLEPYWTPKEHKAVHARMKTYRSV